MINRLVHSIALQRPQLTAPIKVPAFLITSHSGKNSTNYRTCYRQVREQPRYIWNDPGKYLGADLSHQRLVYR
jgi:hypothetical protein